MDTEAKKPGRKKSSAKKSSSITKPRAKKSLINVPIKVLSGDIKEIAHQIYLARQKNGIQGDESSDWLIAEELLMNQITKEMV